MELRFAKPHKANVAIVNDTGSRVPFSGPRWAARARARRPARCGWGGAAAAVTPTNETNKERKPDTPHKPNADVGTDTGPSLLLGGRGGANAMNPFITMKRKTTPLTSSHLG